MQALTLQHATHEPFLTSPRHDHQRVTNTMAGVARC